MDIRLAMSMKQKYGLQLYEASHPAYDAVAEDGREIQIKLTQADQEGAFFRNSLRSYRTKTERREQDDFSQTIPYDIMAQTQGGPEK